MVLGFYAFTSFCLVLALALPAMRVGTAFALALIGASLVQGSVRRHVRVATSSTMR
jgi:hypothetical protein